MKPKAPSKQAQVRERVRACALEVKRFADALQRDYQPEIVRAAMSRYLDNVREAARLAREQTALRRRSRELRERAAQL